MNNLLVVGVETVVGANVAAALSDEWTVTALTREPGIRIAGCTIHESQSGDPEAIAALLAETRAHQVVFCGPAARSNWEGDITLSPEDSAEADLWACACRDAGCGFTLISSDAVLTGPWMFHEESSTSVCMSETAQAVRELEKRILGNGPALIVRTNAFGWSPAGVRGWLEQRLQEVRTRRLVQQDCLRHATPILATDLTGILNRAWSEGLTGLYHIGGAERVNPLSFVQRLADRFELPWLSVRREETLHQRAAGFGEGECSLQTKKIRKALCVAMPMLSECLQRLYEQDQNGFRARLLNEEPTRRERAA